MKKSIRLLGIDDSPFNFKEKYSTVVGVITRGANYLEGVISNKVTIDGSDATFVCINMIKKTRHKKQLRAILIDGVAIGGFNVIDIQEIFDETNLPVITVTRDYPDYTSIQLALKKHFDDWEKRYKIISKGELYEIKTKYNPIFIKCSGLCIDKAKEIINISTIRGVIPEPIRMAHIIASGITRGESYGKA